MIGLVADIPSMPNVTLLNVKVKCEGNIGCPIRLKSSFVPSAPKAELPAQRPRRTSFQPVQQELTCALRSIAPSHNMQPLQRIALRSVRKVRPQVHGQPRRFASGGHGGHHQHPTNESLGVRLVPAPVKGLHSQYLDWKRI